MAIEKKSILANREATKKAMDYAREVRGQKQRAVSSEEQRAERR
jgi:hypothetical protein